MAVNIVTGMTGTEHITSDDFRAINASIFGTGKYVLDYGSKFEPTIVSNNQIRIRDGMCMNQGTQMGIELTDYEDIVIENGVSGENRNDLIVMRYERNADTSIENASLVVIKGKSGITATDPSYISGNILDGRELIDDMPLYRVKIESLTITAVEPLFVVFDSLDQISETVSEMIESGVYEKIESEVATDFSQADTPQFQQTIDDIQTSVSELKGDLGDLDRGLNDVKEDSIVNCKNILTVDKIKRYTDVGVNSQDGSLVPNAGTYAIDFIEVEPSKKYYWNKNVKYGVAFFDNDKNFIRYGSFNSELETPENAYFIKLEIKNEITDLVLYDSSNYKFDINPISMQVTLDKINNVLADDGSIVYFDGGKCSSVYYDVNGKDTIITNACGSGWLTALAFYDSNYNFIACVKNERNKNVKVDVPQKAKYVRFSSEYGDNIYSNVIHDVNNVLNNCVFINSENRKVANNLISDYFARYTDVGVNSQDGSLVPNAGTYAIDFIEVEPSKKYYWNKNVKYGVAFFDNDKNFIRYGSFNSELETPENAYFIKLEIKNEITDLVLYDSSSIIKNNNVEVGYFVSNDSLDITDSKLLRCEPTIKTDFSYKWQLTNEKRYIAIGFDDYDLRPSDYNFVIPLFEKYNSKAEFNKIIYNINPTKSEKNNIIRLLMGGHELGTHTFLHYAFPYNDPLFNGQNPNSLDGNQTEFPTNTQMRTDRGDGKNIFGRDLNENVGIMSGLEVYVSWKSLTDEQCQTIRECYSIFSNPIASAFFDNLSNKYLGTVGTSKGSWDNAKGCYTNGIFTGCKTSENHEVWERILEITEIYYRSNFGLDYNLKTWSMPGTNYSICYFEKNGKNYYDYSYSKLVNHSAKFLSSLTNEERSWNDVLNHYGYKISNDSLYPSRVDGENETAMRTQLHINSSLSKPNALLYSPKSIVPATSFADEYSETFFDGNSDRELQMYQDGGNFYKIVNAIRHDTSNGIINTFVFDSSDRFNDRVFLEGLLRYCKKTGVEVVTKSEAYDICYNHKLYCGNLIYNPNFKNSVKEFIPSATNVPSNPDGYIGDCEVYRDTDTLNVLKTNNTTQYLHYGIPYGYLDYKAIVKGNGTIKIYAIKNSDSITLDNLELLNEIVIDNSTFEDVGTRLLIKDNAITEWEQHHEGYGNKIIGIKIIYSPNIHVKNVRLYK